MSGAAGLSAARRRRAGSSTPSQNKVVSNTSVRNQQRITVQSILENHELRLREVEPRVRELIANNNIISESTTESQVDQSVITKNTTDILALNETVSRLNESINDIQATLLRLTNKVAELVSSGVQSADITVEVANNNISGDESVGNVADVQNEAGEGDNTEVESV